MRRSSSGPRPRTRRALAFVAVASLGLSLAVGTTQPATAAVTVVADGQVDWGVKASFRSYVTGPVGDGTIAVTDGAGTNPDNTFHFPDGTGTADHAAGTLDTAFAGGVRFVAHGGLLDLTIDEIRVTRSGATGNLVADVVSRDLDTGVFDTYPDIALATLNFTAVTPTTAGDDTIYSAVPATLTAAGAGAFADFYPAGTALDPVTVRTSASVGPSTTTTTAPPPTTTTTRPTTTTAPTTATPYGTDTATGVDGQTLTVTPVRDLDPAGERLRVTGRGYDPTIGIYLAFCVDQGPGVPPSPCVGGADMSGESESAVWISDNPPPYGEDLAQPFGPGGTFEYEIEASAVTTDDAGAVIVDCFDTATRCVVATRADHTNGAERRADVKVPVSFVGQTTSPAPPTDPTDPVAPVTVQVDTASVAPGGVVTVRASGFQAGEQVGLTLLPESTWVTAAVADARGAVTTTFVVPATTAPGDHTVEVAGLSSGRSGVSNPFVVLAAPATPTLPATGADATIALAGAGVTLLLAGGGLLALARRRATTLPAG